MDGAAPSTIVILCRVVSSGLSTLTSEGTFLMFTFPSPRTISSLTNSLLLDTLVCLV